MPIKILRGARPSPRHSLAAEQPHEITGPTPPRLLYPPQQRSLWLNDKLGNRVTAEEAFAKACLVPEIFISDDEMRRWATAYNALSGLLSPMCSTR